ncbi:MAG: hypothetical protein COB67_06910 [SAR324 cluster bacterium]|uniref:Uncharacterized protein n=1 Tax=SAR324 cluster bacterium TaxID=2024889 RepID=A0A2A4T3L3_9DELT|nr:MAG: hypothetical protein COB67_06910 [SAR324 cluster bacterium]
MKLKIFGRFAPILTKLTQIFSGRHCFANASNPFEQKYILFVSKLCSSRFRPIIGPAFWGIRVDFLSVVLRGATEFDLVFETWWGEFILKWAFPRILRALRVLRG